MPTYFMILKHYFYNVGHRLVSSIGLIKAVTSCICWPICMDILVYNIPKHSTTVVWKLLLTTVLCRHEVTCRFVATYAKATGFFPMLLSSLSFLLLTCLQLLLPTVCCSLCCLPCLCCWLSPLSLCPIATVIFLCIRYYYNCCFNHCYAWLLLLFSCPCHWLLSCCCCNLMFLSLLSLFTVADGNGCCMVLPFLLSPFSIFNAAIHACICCCHFWHLLLLPLLLAAVCCCHHSLFLSLLSLFTVAVTDGHCYCFFYQLLSLLH